jgi:copper transport protein
MQVLDAGGRNHARGAVQPVPGQPNELQIGVGSLSAGVYTVTWRTVSEQDGHTTAGSFSFGMNVSQSQISRGAGTASVVKSPSPPPLAVAGRWALYWGLVVLFAGAVTRFLVFRGALPLRGPALVGAWALAVLGLAGTIAAERFSAGVSYSQLFSSTSGHHLLREIAALGATTIALVLALVVRRAWSIVVLGVAAAASMFMHAWNSHASAAPPVWFNVGVQWIHLLSVATWVGGLVWLLIGLRGRPDEERPAIASRFSRMAGIALAVVAATGITRAIDEVGTPPDWGRLFDSSFGITLLVKVALFVALVVFGARNRYVNVPGLAGGTRRVGSLRRTLTAEVAIAAGILGATGVLSELPPAASAAASGSPRAARVTQVVATGHDFATSVRTRLVVTPGTVGPNTFAATVHDFDTGRPVNATAVTLSFSLPGHPEIGQPSLALHQRGSRWIGQGTVLSMFGTWDVSMLVQEPTGGVQVPLSVQTRLPPEQIQVAPGSPGQPTVYTITLPGQNTLQTYVDPGKSGPNVVHFTFFLSSGNERPIASAQASEITPSGTTRAMRLIRFDKGHFAANVGLASGRWTFLIDATPRTGPAVSAHFAQIIQGGGT